MNSKKLKSVLFVGILFALGACAAMGFTDDTKKLIETAAFDQNCPKEKVSVKARHPAGSGVTKYVMSVCGKQMRYVRLGTSYFEASKAPVPQ